MVENVGELASTPLRIAAYGNGSARAAVQIRGPSVLPSEAQRVELVLPESPVAEAVWRVVTTAGDHPPVESRVEYVVVAPDLKVGIVAPPEVETDNLVEVAVSVENAGRVRAHAVTVSVTVPDEVLYRGASDGGSPSVGGDLVEWHLGELPAGGRWEGSVRFEGFAPGKVRVAAAVSSAGSVAATTEAPLACVVGRSAGVTLSQLLGAFPAPLDDTVEPTTAALRAAGERHLMFSAAGSRFAVPLGSVREVLRPLPLTPVPGAPEWVAGVANVRGDVVLTIELAGFLGLSDIVRPRWLVILSGADSELGLLVSDLPGIRPLIPADDADVSPLDRLAGFLAGLSLDPAGVVHRLDPTTVLAAAESDVTAAV